MGKSSLSFGLLAALFSSAASTQSVPEGIHSETTGVTEMCGLRGRDARELMERVRAAANLRRGPIESDRFEVFESLDHHDQWVMTRPSEPAYPAVTCRHFYVENGSTYHTRNMRCDADRAACDRLLIELRELDLQMIDYIRRMSGPVTPGT